MDRRSPDYRDTLRASLHSPVSDTFHSRRRTAAAPPPGRARRARTEPSRSRLVACALIYVTSQTHLSPRPYIFSARVSPVTRAFSLIQCIDCRCCCCTTQHCARFFVFMACATTDATRGAQHKTHTHTHTHGAHTHMAHMRVPRRGPLVDAKGGAHTTISPTCEQPLSASSGSQHPFVVTRRPPPSSLLVLPPLTRRDGAGRPWSSTFSCRTAQR